MAKSVYSRFGASAVEGTENTQHEHTVKGNETLSSIAAYEYVTGYDSELWRQIAEANSIDDLDALATNTVLVIPPPAASET